MKKNISLLLGCLALFACNSQYTANPVATRTNISPPPSDMPRKAGSCYARCMLPNSTEWGDWEEVLCASKINEKFLLNVQEKLAALGYDTNPINGTLGKEDKAALTAYQKSQNLPIGQFDFKTLKRLGINP